MNTRKLKLVGSSLVIFPSLVGLVVVFFFVSKDVIDQKVENEEQLERIAPAIIKIAQENIVKPEFPSKPAGRTEVVTVTKWKIVNLGIAKTKVPIQVQEERFVGPSTEDIGQWEKTVKELEDKYDSLVAKEAERIIKENNKNAAKEEVKFWLAVISPLISSVIGIATLLLAFRTDRREREKHELEMAKISQQEA